MGISWEAEEEGPSTEPKPVAPTAIRKSIPSVKYFIFGLPFRHFFSAPVLRVERRFYIVRKVLPGWPFIPPPCHTTIHPLSNRPIHLSSTSSIHWHWRKFLVGRLSLGNPLQSDSSSPVLAAEEFLFSCSTTTFLLPARPSSRGRTSAQQPLPEPGATEPSPAPLGIKLTLKDDWWTTTTTRRRTDIKQTHLAKHRGYTSTRSESNPNPPSPTHCKQVSQFPLKCDLQMFLRNRFCGFFQMEMNGNRDETESYFKSLHPDWN